MQDSPIGLRINAQGHTGVSGVEQMNEASVIVTAGECAESLREAILSVLRKPWARHMEIVAVTERGVNLEEVWLPEQNTTEHTIKVVVNQFAPGPKGARHTGLLASTTSVIAFCDDGEAWERNWKTAEQGTRYVDPADVAQGDLVIR